MMRVIIESPFRGDERRNLLYLRLCIQDSLRRGEAPFASVRMYVGALDDQVQDQRARGMEAGFAWMETAHLVAVYTDYGVSEGMTKGIARARRLGIPVEERNIAAARVLVADAVLRGEEVEHG